MNELQVYNECRRHLEVGGFNILQLVAPGGQCPLSLTIRGPTGRRTVFPDLVASKDSTVFVGELKARFSRPDYNKLISILSDQGVDDQLKRMMKISGPLSKVGVLCHSQAGSLPVELVDQWVFSEGAAMVHISGL